MDFELKTLLGLAAVLMTVVAHVPYLVTTLKGTNKPHIFTWIIWTLLTFIAFAAQVADNAGPGAWSTGMTGIICVIITFAALRTGEWDITRLDWVMFLAGLAAIPAWLLTSDPLWSVLIVVGIDCAAFGPTYRKSWHKPFEENSFMYGFNIPRHVMAISALQTVSLTTALYPAALLLMNVIMYVMLKLRRAKYAPV
jgi:hypothetical protein